MAEHAALRAALGEPMPQSGTMVLLYGKGGHLATREYSIVVVRGADGIWHGTGVGHSQIWVQDAPYTPLERMEWILDPADGQALDAALAHSCPPPAPAAPSSDPGPPPRGFGFERVDVVMPGRPTLTFSSSAGDGAIANLIRPPE